MIRAGIRWVALMLAVVPLGAKDQLTPPEARETRDLEGWTVYIDRSLLEREHSELGERATRLLEARLADLVLLLPPDKVERLRKVPIWLDRRYGKARGMCYHPNPRWLEENGYEVELAKGVHIQSARNFVSKGHQQVQPWSVLHELAHAYHDQVLGFDEPRLIAAWKAFGKSGKYQKCRHINRRDVRHYGLTNQKEFFAEMTEAFFGRNDFEPFHKADLEDNEPEIYRLMESIWISRS